MHHPFATDVRNQIAKLKHTLETSRSHLAVPKEFQVDWDKKWEMLTEGVICHYSEPHRDYHDLEHVASGLSQLSVLTNQDIPTLLANLFHDVIYLAGAPSGMNELCSALYAKQMLDGIIKEHYLEQIVCPMITATARHLIPDDFVGDELNLGYLIDVDLLSLSAEKRIFDRNRTRIRNEFCGLVSDEDFTTGTAKFAQSMLDRGYIYHTDTFKQLEAAARTNLQTLL